MTRQMNYPKPDIPSNPDAIQKDIERQRKAMDQTLDQLASRIDPSQILETTMNTFKTNISEATNSVCDVGSRVADSASKHPFAWALGGAALAWLAFDRKVASSGNGADRQKLRYSSAREDNVSDRATEALHHAKDAAENKASGYASAMQERAQQAGQRASEAIDHAEDQVKDEAERISSAASEKASRIADQTSEVASKGKQHIESVMEEHPLAVGLATIGVGMVVGYFLPSSKEE
jgi:ElaB/YqjD/DUF883 family membrane-anchored ribosome-binding protein